MRRLIVAALTGLVLPAAAAAQGLGPRTLLPMHVACGDVAVATAPAPASYRIDGAQITDARQALSPGDVAVIRLDGAAAPAIGQALIARRLDGDREAFRKGVSGFAGIRTAGILTVTAVDERFALARVDRACAEVLVGDWLEPAVLPTLPAPDAPGQPAFDDRARVLFGGDLREAFGDGDVLAIDRGTTHGVAPGQRFALYREPLNRGQGSSQRMGSTRVAPAAGVLPLIALGEIVVIDATETTARAVVVRALDAIVSGDVAVRVMPDQP